ncbi:MAG: hypothetical protein ABI325_10170 [Ginsengibacter sp.]
MGNTIGRLAGEDLFLKKAKGELSLLNGFTNIAAWLLIVFFILILPASIYAAINHIDYQMRTFDGNGSSYLGLEFPCKSFYCLDLSVSFKMTKMFKNALALNIVQLG